MVSPEETRGPPCASRSLRWHPRAPWWRSGSRPGVRDPWDFVEMKIQKPLGVYEDPVAIFKEITNHSGLERPGTTCPINEIRDPRVMDIYHDYLV